MPSKTHRFCSCSRAGVALLTLALLAAGVTLLGAQCACPAVLAGYDVTAEWIQKNGYEIAESPREVWHSPPGNDEKIEVVWLFK